MTVATVHVPHPSKAVAVAIAAATAVAAAAAIALAVGAADTGQTAPGAPAQVVPAELPRPAEAPIGSADALERRAAAEREAVSSDRFRFGSADAAERQLSR